MGEDQHALASDSIFTEIGDLFNIATAHSAERYYGWKYRVVTNPMLCVMLDGHIFRLPQGGVWQLLWGVYRSQGTRDIGHPVE